MSRRRLCLDYDLLAAGFPCQPFSLAGVSKKNSLGRAHGFDDEKSGNLFFEIERLLRDGPKPRVVFLENVRNLRSHDKGRTIAEIRRRLEVLGYELNDRIIDARSWVPQHRERIFIIGFLREAYGGRRFDFPESIEGNDPKLGTILETDVDDRYVLTENLWTYLQGYRAKHAAKGNGFGFGLVGPEDTTRTLSARYHKDGSEILVETDGDRPRRLTPRECRSDGLSHAFDIDRVRTQAYRQFGTPSSSQSSGSWARRSFVRPASATRSPLSASWHLARHRRPEDTQPDDVRDPRQGHQA